MAGPCEDVNTALAWLAAAKEPLAAAHHALYRAVTAHAEAKRVLELAEADALCEGVPGKNERERTAQLRLLLDTEHSAVHKAEDALAESRCAYEVARLEWDLVRYQVRALETQPTEVAA